MFAVSSLHAPPPPGVPPPVRWGDPATVQERLRADFHDIRTQIITLDFDMPLNAAATVDHFRKYFGPTQTAFNRLNTSGQQAFTQALTALWSDANTAANPSHHMLVPNEYPQVLATRNG